VIGGYWSHPQFWWQSYHLVPAPSDMKHKKTTSDCLRAEITLSMLSIEAISR
jgi:hypothetical protein